MEASPGSVKQVQVVVLTLTAIILMLQNVNEPVPGL